MQNGKLYQLRIEISNVWFFESAWIVLLNIQHIVSSELWIVNCYLSIKFNSNEYLVCLDIFVQHRAHLKWNRENTKQHFFFCIKYTHKLFAFQKLKKWTDTIGRCHQYSSRSIWWRPDIFKWCRCHWNDKEKQFAKFEWIWARQIKWAGDKPKKRKIDQWFQENWTDKWKGFPMI